MGRSRRGGAARSGGVRLPAEPGRDRLARPREPARRLRLHPPHAVAGEPLDARRGLGLARLARAGGRIPDAARPRAGVLLHLGGDRHLLRGRVARGAAPSGGASPQYGATGRPGRGRGAGLRDRRLLQPAAARLLALLHSWDRERGRRGHRLRDPVVARALRASLVRDSGLGGLRRLDLLGRDAVHRLPERLHRDRGARPRSRRVPRRRRAAPVRAGDRDPVAPDRLRPQLPALRLPVRPPAAVQQVPRPGHGDRAVPARGRARPGVGLERGDRAGAGRGVARPPPGPAAPRPRGDPRAGDAGGRAGAGRLAAALRGGRRGASPGRRAALLGRGRGPRLRRLHRRPRARRPARAPGPGRGVARAPREALGRRRLDRAPGPAPGRALAGERPRDGVGPRRSRAAQPRDRARRRHRLPREGGSARELPHPSTRVRVPEQPLRGLRHRRQAAPGPGFSGSPAPVQPRLAEPAQRPLRRDPAAHAARAGMAATGVRRLGIRLREPAGAAARDGAGTLPGGDARQGDPRLGEERLQRELRGDVPRAGPEARARTGPGRAGGDHVLPAERRHDRGGDPRAGAGAARRSLVPGLDRHGGRAADRGLTISVVCLVVTLGLLGLSFWWRRRPAQSAPEAA